jgi:hypothetical protein
MNIEQKLARTALAVLALSALAQVNAEDLINNSKALRIEGKKSRGETERLKKELIEKFKYELNNKRGEISDEDYAQEQEKIDAVSKESASLILDLVKKYEENRAKDGKSKIASNETSAEPVTTKTKEMTSSKERQDTVYSGPSNSEQESLSMSFDEDRYGKLRKQEEVKPDDNDFYTPNFNEIKEAGEAEKREKAKEEKRKQKSFSAKAMATVSNVGKAAMKNAENARKSMSDYMSSWFTNKKQ